MYKVIFLKNARKSFKRIPRDYQRQLKTLIKRIEVDPFAVDIKKLGSAHEADYRIRLGAYRIFLHIDLKSKEVLIAGIERRTSKTYKRN